MLWPALEAGDTICSCAGVGLALGAALLRPVSRGWCSLTGVLGVVLPDGFRERWSSEPPWLNPMVLQTISSRLRAWNRFWCSPDFDTVSWEIPDLDTKECRVSFSPRCTPPLVTLPLFQAASVPAQEEGPYCDGLVGRLLMLLAAA